MRSRWRLVLIAAGSAALALGILVAQGSTPDHSQASAPSEEPIAWKRLDKLPIEGAARRVARDFIVKAGFQTDVQASWELIDRTYEMRGRYRKAAWTKGNVPVRPVSFPLEALRAMRFHLFERTDDRILLDVALFSTALRPDRFEIGLKRRAQRWLVDFWMCRYPCRGRPKPG